MSISHQEIADMANLLGDSDREFVYELIKRLLPDDVATADDFAAHTAAMEEYARGETMRAEEIDWDESEDD